MYKKLNKQAIARFRTFVLALRDEPAYLALHDDGDIPSLLLIYALRYYFKVDVGYENWGIRPFQIFFSRIDIESATDIDFSDDNKKLTSFRAMAEAAYLLTVIESSGISPDNIRQWVDCGLAVKRFNTVDDLLTNNLIAKWYDCYFLMANEPRAMKYIEAKILDAEQIRYFLENDIDISLAQAVRD